MNFDFDTIIPRRGTDSYKWDSPAADDILPMWVADMDFRTAPEIIEALQKRVEHGVFGYAKVPPAYYESIIRWFERRHSWSIRREWILSTTGVVPAISAILQGIAAPGDKVITLTPVYNCFFSSIRNSGCVLEDCPLHYENGLYSIDFDAFEKQLADAAVKFLLLCNPHNPTGRVWSRSELSEISRLCEKHGVFVISDEIHCEMIAPGFRYTPYATVSENALMGSVTCMSPSKSFNIAGIQVSNIVCADAALRAKIDRSLQVNEIADVGVFGIPALIAAYDKGEPWLDALNAYFHENDMAFREFCGKYLPQYPLPPKEASYLEWLDCTPSGMDGDEVARRLLEEQKLMVNPGSMYGEAGRPFIRINIACSRTLMMQGLEKIRRVLAPSDRA